MEGVLFQSSTVLLRTLLAGVLAYVALVAILRISGKRTLAKLNAFDFVVTVALGSALANIVLNQDVSVAEGVLAFALLIGLQFIITWSSMRLGWVRRVVTGEPAILLYRGAYLPDALRRSRTTEAEVRAAVRAAGQAALSGVEAVVLETDGSLSVVPRGSEDATSLDGLEKPFHAQPEPR